MEDEATPSYRDEIEDIYPLSPMQQGMLYHSLLAPGSGVYVVQLSCLLPQSLSDAAFERAWQHVIERHAILRTAFIWEELDEPLQVVHARVPLPLVREDWSGLAEAEQQARLRRYLEADQQRGFDFSEAPLMRFALFRLAESAYQFVWSFHHILLDGWSTPIVLKEVFSCYEAFAQGRPPELAPSAPFGDYIAWLQRQSLAQAEEFWRETLRGLHAPPPMGLDDAAATQAAQHQAVYEEQHDALPATLTGELRALARRAQVTVNTIVQGAWAIVLSRYSGEPDVLFGAVVSGRPPELHGVASMVGLFINTLPVRVRVPAQATVFDWLRELQRQQLELRQYEHTPLSQIQAWSEIPAGQPLFKSILVFENYPVDDSVREHSDRLDVQHVQALERTNYPLTLTAEVGNHLGFSLQYDTSRFETGAVTRLMGHLRNVLEAIIEEPEQRLSDVSLLSDAERRQILFDFNRTRADFDTDTCIHRMFEAQAARTPDATALVFENQRLSYEELNRRANRLARLLRRKGVGPEVSVGILLERSVEMIVSLLAVLKAGGAYVPLDPAYPHAHLSFILKDSEAALLLTEQRLLERLPDTLAPKLLCLGSDWAQAEAESDANLDGGACAGNIAYLIYTSGSTGRPKGVMVEHRSLVNYVRAANTVYGIHERDRVLQFASLSFDASAEEIYISLSVGATLVLRTEEMLDAAAVFLRRCAELGVTAASLPTGYFHQIMSEVETDGLELPEPLRLLIIGGEKALPEPVAAWQRRFAQEVRLINSYGPTESTIAATACDLTLSSPGASADAEVSIGKVLPNLEAYVLDEQMRPCPVAIRGELMLGGAGLARGYLRRPDLTAERFIPHPFSAEPGARLYRTGDLAAYAHDGSIRYLGRLDHQVKLRGFRIELSEIESQLNQHPSVQESVADVREQQAGDSRLVAYVVPKAGEDPSSRELQSFLQERLPSYMLPSAYVRLAALPLLPNGKLDRRALPDPALDGATHEADNVPPATHLELQLIHIWENILGSHPIGITDNFFTLGGHSLLALRLMAEIRKELGEDLPLSILLKNPTIENLAKEIRRQTGPLPWTPLVAIQPHGTRRPFFCVHPIGGQVLCYYQLAQHVGRDQPFYGLHAPDLSQAADEPTTIEEMAARYIEAIREVQPSGPYLLGGYSFGGTVAFEMAQQLLRDGEEVALLAMLDTWSPVLDRTLGVLPEDAFFLYGLITEQVRQRGKAPRVSYEYLRQLEPDMQFTYVLDEGKRENIIHPETGVEWLRRFVAGYKSRYQATLNYVARPTRSRISLFRCNEQDAEVMRYLEDHGVETDDPTLGWSEYSTEGVDVYQLPGIHETLYQEPQVQLLAAHLKTAIEKATATQLLAQEV